MAALKPQTFRDFLLAIVITWLLLPQLVFAESDKQMQEQALRNREMLQHSSNPAKHLKPLEGPDFRGVYYGYFPCQEADCSGIKITLSLKRNNNYLLVTQPAKPSSREFYEKGKFTWDDTGHTVVLTQRDKPDKKHYRIIDEGTLVQLNEDGSALAGDQDSYTLRRGDTVKSREVHIH